jgi:methylenetetrahydrofolate dehydrogenase (NADP+) / methenyltetrahydrofolate cyclohydrolase
MLLNGRSVLCRASAALSKVISGRTVPPVHICLFRQGNMDLFRAAIHSSQEKVKAFRRSGVDAFLITDDNWSGFFATKTSLLNSHFFKVVQKPLPIELDNLIIDNGYDLDYSPLAGRQQPIISEVAIHLMSKLNSKKEPVVVVGGKGYFGSYIQLQLEKAGIRTGVVDVGDSMHQIGNYNFVITAASCGCCVSKEHVHPDQVIVDIGYVPHGNTFVGNVCSSAYKIPRIVTPVPGGTGPMQMAVLLFRYANSLGLDLEYDVFGDLSDIGNILAENGTGNGLIEK